MMGDDLQLAVQDGLSARALLLSMRRHLGLVLGLSLSLCAAGAVVGLGLPSWFQAETVLIIPARPQRIADVQELPDPVPDLPVMRSEVDVLQSRSVIEPVVRSLALWRLPEFQKREYPGGWNWQNLEARLSDIWSVIWSVENRPELSSRDLPGPSTPPDKGDAPPQAQIDEAIEKYARYLFVQTDGHS